jgi:hypothetical protein
MGRKKTTRRCCRSCVLGVAKEIERHATNMKKDIPIGGPMFVMHATHLAIAKCFRRSVKKKRLPLAQALRVGAAR